MQVALVQCPVWGVYSPPVALAQMSGYLKSKGHDVRVFDINVDLYNKRTKEYDTVWAIEQSSFWCNPNNVAEFHSFNRELIEESIEKIIAFTPDAAGFSVNVCSFHSTLFFAREIKKKLPSLKTIIGGPPYMVSDDAKLLEEPAFDFLIRGEGEETFAELLACLSNGKDLNSCKGIAYKRNGKIIINEGRPPIKNLDEMPFLDLSDTPLDVYDPPEYQGRHIALMCSRGCIWNCAFCGSRAYWQGYRCMSGARIHAEIEHHLLKDPKIKHIELLDLLFNGNMRALEDFCDLTIKSPVKGRFKWHANAIIRPEMTEELAKKMKEAGCWQLSIGIESGSQKVLRLMKKNYKIEVADRVLKNIHEVGIRVTCNFMFGFPGETEEDFGKTLEFVKRNAQYIDTAYPSRTYCTIEPFSYLESHLDEFSMLPSPVHGQYWQSKDGTNTYPERMRRCEVFSEYAHSLGVDVGLGLQTSIEMDRCLNLGDYYASIKDYRKAKTYYEKYLELDSGNQVIKNKLTALEVV